MDDQHALLAKDFVRLQLLEADVHYEETIGKFLILAPRDDGSLVRDRRARWKGARDKRRPVGDTGFALPTSFEEKRHLKRMLDRTAPRLTPAEILQNGSSIRYPSRTPSDRRRQNEVSLRSRSWS